jgi:hypothetical protein
MAIEIIPKKEQEQQQPLSSFLYNIGKALLIIAVLSSLIFVFFDWKFVRETKAINQEITQRKTEEVLSLERKVDNYGRKTKTFSQLIQDRKSSKSFFQLIEDVIHPDVVLTEFKASLNENQISIKGSAKNSTAFDQQVKLFHSRINQTIYSFEVPDFTREEDRSITFPVDITLIAGEITCLSEKSNSIEIGVSYVNGGQVYLFDRNRKIYGPLSSGTQYLYENLTPRTTYELNLRNGDNPSLIPFVISFCRTTN